MPLFQPATINSPFSGTLYNGNMVLAENSFADLGPYVIIGLTATIGTGLSVNLASGTASIGGRVTVSSTTIAGLTDNQPAGSPNHLYLLNTGGTTSNTTGTAPANSVKLGTAVTLGGVVTSVSMGRTSGRQQFRQPQNLVPGGPSAGTLSAGHPDGINLASWGATDAEGQALYGTLPGGAVAGMTPPVTYTLDDANQNSVQTVLTVRHTYNAGGGATGIGAALDFSAESATNATNRLVASLQASLPDATAATATGKLSLQVIANNAQVVPLTVAGQDIRIPQATASAAAHGLLNIGSGGFDGSAGHYAGAAQGTLLALNAPSGFTGYLAGMQVNGVSLWLIQNNAGFLTNVPNAAANFGLMNLGDVLSTFDGSSGGHFAGSSAGTYLAINSGSSFTGDLVRYQHQGSDRYRQTDTGDVTVTLRDAGTTTAPNTLTTIHRSSGTPAANFGATHLLQLDNASNTITNAASLQTLWSTATAGNESSLLKLSIRYNGTDVEVARCRAVGTTPSGGIGGQFQASSDFLHAGTLLAFYNGTPSAKQAVTGSRGGNAALASLITALSTIGLLTDSSSA